MTVAVPSPALKSVTKWNIGSEALRESKQHNEQTEGVLDHVPKITAAAKAQPLRLASKRKAVL